MSWEMQDEQSACVNDRRLAIERAAEIERLKYELAKHTELWHAAQKLSDTYETQRDELADQVSALTEENARLKATRETLTETKPQENP